MCRSLLRRGMSLAATALVTASLLAGPAWAEGVPGQTSDQSASHSGNTYVPKVIVIVTSNGVRTTTAASAPLTKEEHPPCWMEPLQSGPDMFDWYASGDAYRLAHHTGDPRPTPPADYAEHQNDGPDKGMYWSSMCSTEFWDGDLASFFAYTDEFFAAHPTQWVSVAEGDPNDDLVIPPEVLMHVAQRSLDLSRGPDIEVNPDGDSVVNLPTWVWATNATFVEQRVRAEFNGNWAEVIATPVRLVVSTSGPADLSGNCNGGGTVYRPGASSTNCSVTFRKSSLAPGTFSISASIEWRVHWEGSGGQNEGLPPPDAPGVTTVQVPVDEVQTVLQNTPTPPAR